MCGGGGRMPGCGQGQHRHRHNRMGRNGGKVGIVVVVGKACAGTKGVRCYKCMGKQAQSKMGMWGLGCGSKCLGIPTGTRYSTKQTSGGHWQFTGTSPLNVTVVGVGAADQQATHQAWVRCGAQTTAMGR